MHMQRHAENSYSDECDGKNGGAFGHCSGDRFKVWHGRSTPAIACGRHAEYELAAVATGHSNRESE